MPNQDSETLNVATLNRIMPGLTELTRSLGDQILAGPKASIEVQKDGGVDMATNYDQLFEQELYEYITAHFPEHGFQGEEFPELNRKSRYTWYVDPIDGTKWFVAGVGLWTNTVSLVDTDTNEAIAGIIYDPAMKNMYTAVKGQGAFLNGEKLSLDHSNEDPMQQIITVDITPRKYEWEEVKDKVYQIEIGLRDEFYRVREIGAGAVALAKVATGHLAAFVAPYHPLKEYLDHNAGILIAREAGAEVWINPIDDDVDQLVVGTKPAVEAIKKLIQL